MKQLVWTTYVNFMKDGHPGSKSTIEFSSNMVLATNYLTIAHYRCRAIFNKSTSSRYAPWCAFTVTPKWYNFLGFY